MTYSSLDDLTVDTMGLSYVDRTGKQHLYHSNRPDDHVREAQTMDQIVKNYRSSAEGQSFIEYAHSKGRRFIDIVGAGAGDIGEYVIAALIHDGEKGIIVSNYDGKDFGSRIAEFARMYNIDSEAALEYVLAHEMSHAAGNRSEESTERFIGEYFLEMARNSDGSERDKYEQLVEVAQQRAQEAHYQENN